MYLPWSPKILMTLWLSNCYFQIKPVQANFTNCKDVVKEHQICKVDENILEKYLKHPPNHLKQSGLIQVMSKLTIESVPEFNSQEGTISVNALLKLIWNDTRISINFPNDTSSDTV